MQPLTRRSLLTAAATVPLLSALPTAARAATGPHIALGALNRAPEIGGDRLIQRTFDPGLIEVSSATRYGPQRRIHSYAAPSADDDIRRYLRAARSDDWIGYRHEGDLSIQNGDTTMTEWRQNTLRLAELIDEVGRGLQHVTILGWSTSRQSSTHAIANRMLEGAVTTMMQRTGAVLGFDVYPGPDPTTNVNTPQDSLLGRPARHAQRRGLAWMVPEIALPQTRGVDDEEHAAWWRATFDVIGSSQVPTPPVAFCAWNPHGTHGDVYAVQDNPLSAAAWRAAVRRYV